MEGLASPFRRSMINHSASRVFMLRQPKGELKRAIFRQAEQKREVMTQHIVKMLAEIHSEFGIFDSARFTVKDSKNLIHLLSDIPELAYLRQFYFDYKSAARKRIWHTSEPGPPTAPHQCCNKRRLAFHWRIRDSNGSCQVSVCI